MAYAENDLFKVLATTLWRGKVKHPGMRMDFEENEINLDYRNYFEYQIANMYIDN